jgi:hypothetical protein
VCFDSTNYFVAWEDYRNVHQSDIWGTRVTPAGVVLDPVGIPVVTEDGEQLKPAVTADGANFIVVWEDYRNDPDSSDIYGARVSSSGLVLERFAVTNQDGGQFEPAVTRGPGEQVLLAYHCWIGTAHGRPYNAVRIWGKFGPFPGSIEEDPRPSLGSSHPNATIVRGVLFLPASLRPAHNSLLSIDGRKVMDLAPGANDVRHLSRGVYFVRSSPIFAGSRQQAVARIVIP